MVTRFAAGFFCGVLAALWWLGRPVRRMSQRVEEEWRVPDTEYDGEAWVW
jgi:hypothetical protein